MSVHQVDGRTSVRTEQEEDTASVYSSIAAHVA